MHAKMHLQYIYSLTVSLCRLNMFNYNYLNGDTKAQNYFKYLQDLFRLSIK